MKTLLPIIVTIQLFLITPHGLTQPPEFLDEQAMNKFLGEVELTLKHGRLLLNTLKPPDETYDYQCSKLFDKSRSELGRSLNEIIPKMIEGLRNEKYKDNSSPQYLFLTSIQEAKEATARFISILEKCHESNRFLTRSTNFLTGKENLLAFKKDMELHENVFQRHFAQRLLRNDAKMWFSDGEIRDLKSQLEECRARK